MSDTIKQLVNTPHLMEAFKLYIEGKITQTQRSLEQSFVIEEIYRHQGAIAAYRKLLLIRDEINYRDTSAN